MRTTMETFTNAQGEEVRKEKYNHLAAAEMSSEVNYNKIDGIMGNNKQVSSLEQKLKDAQERAKRQRDKQSEQRKDHTETRKNRRHREHRHNGDRKNHRRNQAR